MRTRSNLLDPVVIPAVTKSRNRFGGAAWGNWTTKSGNWYTQDQQVMTDRKTLGYFKAVREGTVIPVSPMNSTKTTTIIVPVAFKGVVMRLSGGLPDRFEYDIEGHFLDPNPGGVSYTWGDRPSVNSPNGDIYLQEALSRAQSDAYDALTFAAEFRKTVEGVVTLRSRAMTILERFESAVNSKRRKRRYRGMEIGQILAEVWLEMRYMWRPLVYDMQAAQEAIRRLQEGIEDPLQRAYATGSGGESSLAKSQETSNVWWPSSTGGLSGIDQFIVRSCVAERTVHASVGLKVTTRDITMVDPFVTGWELVPFSFVLDWFITIGDMLTAFSPFATGQLQYATLATKTTYTYRTVSAFRAQAAYGWTLESSSVNQPGTAVRIDEVYSRVPATPTPTIAVDVNLNVAKIIDLVALWSVINRKTLTRLLRHF